MLKTLARHFIKGLLYLVDKDHRSTETISNANIKKFTHVQDVDFKSDFSRAVKAVRTVPYQAWELKTVSSSLIAADRHRVIRGDGSAAWLEDLIVGDTIRTASGIEPVTSCRSLGIRLHMYCLQLDGDETQDSSAHHFYTNNILSHNTTCASAYLLWYATMNPSVTVLIAANKLNQAIEIMDRIKYAYENLPDYIRAGMLEYNKTTVSFDNGSRIICRATSADAGRGLSISKLYVDEMAFLPRNISDAFWTSIQPTLAVGGSCIITSTPKNDEDQFAQIWKGAVDTTDEYGNPRSQGVGKNGFFAVLSPWHDHPERDEAWADGFRQTLGEARFRQEFCCEFYSNDPTLINALTLVRLTGHNPIQYTGTVRWYSEPQPNKTYIVTLDPSLGVGNSGDNAAIQVFQLPEMLQVAEWQHNDTIPRGQVRILLQTLLYLDDTLRDHPSQRGEPDIYWSLESNSIGEALLMIIEDTGEERFPGIMISEPRKSGGSRRRKGLLTTNRSKLSACARMKSLIESDRMEIRSPNLIRELKNFVATDNSFKAKSGEKDDLVMATVLAVRMLDIVLAQGGDAGDLREYIDDDELGDGEAMPFAF